MVNLCKRLVEEEDLRNRENIEVFHSLLEFLYILMNVDDQCDGHSLPKRKTSLTLPNIAQLLDWTGERTAKWKIKVAKVSQQLPLYLN